MSDDITARFGGLTIMKQETEVYKDDRGNYRIGGCIIAEPEFTGDGDVPERETIGTVEEINDDGTVTVALGGESDG